MKKLLLFACIVFAVTSCGIFGKPKYGCPGNGKNVGAERILSGDPQAIKAARKAGKFKD